MFPIFLANLKSALPTTKVSIARSNPNSGLPHPKPMDFPGPYMGYMYQKNQRKNIASNMFFKKGQLIPHLFD